MAPQRSVKIKIKVNFFFSSGIGAGRVNGKNCCAKIYFNSLSDIPKNGQTHLNDWLAGQTQLNDSSATADELFECVWPFCGVGA